MDGRGYQIIMKEILKKIKEWRCVRCHESLELRAEHFFCQHCGVTFKISDGVPYFLPTNISLVSGGPDHLRDFFKQWPGFYYFVATFFGPIFFSGLSPKNFLRRYAQEDDGPILNIGSGPRILVPAVINVDIFPYKGVSLVADIAHLPLADESVSSIVCDNILEHVGNPADVAAEIQRVLKPCGAVYICAPFMYPFHSSPSDYTRWTLLGLSQLFDRSEVVESGVRAGVFSALNVYCCYLFAFLFSFGNRRLYWILVNVSMFFFFPIKLLDAIFCHFSFAKNMAAVVYCVLRKK